MNEDILNTELLIYQTPEGNTKVDVQMHDETVWMTQADMAKLFQTTPQNITMHLKSIFEEGELNEELTCKEFLQVRIIESSNRGLMQKHLMN